MNLRGNQLKGSIILGNYGVSMDCCKLIKYFKIFPIVFELHGMAGNITPSTFEFYYSFCSQYLTQLDISENSIEVLNLSALDKLETIQCCRNKLLELTINGTVLKSLIAGNNSKCPSIINSYLRLSQIFHSRYSQTSCDTDTS